MERTLSIKPTSLDWLRDEDAFVAGYMRGLGFRSLSELLPMRVYDLLNMNRIDAIKAEEIIISLYRHIHPDNEELDDDIYYGFVEQSFNFIHWRTTHPLSKVTISDLVWSEGINREAIYDLYELIKKAFWRSGEYDWHRYKYQNMSEYYTAMAEKTHERD